MVQLSTIELMFKIRTYNAIAEKGLALLDEQRYQVGSDVVAPEGILCRSANLHELALNPELLAIGRAGAGVNNIPLEKCNINGVVVFNTPGANANAVKELVLTGLLLASRHIHHALRYPDSLEGDDEEIHRLVEENKKRFKGIELPNRTLGVIGLGQIGVKVANAASALGMRVIGYDPAITIENAWELSPEVLQAKSIDEVCQQSEFLTVHAPLNKQTRHLINQHHLSLLPKNAVVLNLARNGIVDNDAVIEAIREQHLSYYITDFPLNAFREFEQIITLPHLGASTVEAEENCAVMVAKQMRDFLEKGYVYNSVNLPSVKLAPMENTQRLTIINQNIPNMVAQICEKLGKHNLNIVDMVNKSKQELAYNIIDVTSDITDDVIEDLNNVNGILRVRYLPKVGR